MDDLQFSFIIPVFNRPDEIRELLESMLHLESGDSFEVVIVEDGSTLEAREVVEQFSGTLNISYYRKENSGPGNSRNYGMQRAKGNYFVILDSDCLLPKHYLSAVEKELKADFVHCFGGADAAHESFSDVQKAINYAMTAFLTTGGIRGSKKALDRFQPRSFNMGISKTAFEKTKGFGNIHPGEDPDLTFRIWDAGFRTRFFPDAFVYHKRRMDWDKFYTQVNKFGMVRPILNKWHPKTVRITYWFPTLLILGVLLSCVLVFLGWSLPLVIFGGYFLLLFLDALVRSKSIGIAFLSIKAVCIQFLGYGMGFLKSVILVNFSGKEPEILFPKLFFKQK